MCGVHKMKKGEFALSNVAGILLVLIGFLILILLIYFFRDKIKELIEMILGVFRI